MTFWNPLNAVEETLADEACFKRRIPPAENRDAGGSWLQYGCKGEGVHMAKTKFIAIVAAAALAAMLGLSACGGQASSSAASSSSGSSAAASSSASASSSEAASSSASASASSAAAEDTVVSWQGVLVDGTLVDFISSDDGKHGSLVITKDSAQEPKRWVGEMTTSDDGKATITDDTSKETINFALTGFVKDGAMLVDIEGYGQGALVPMTAADWKMVAEAEELAKTLDAKVNSIGVFEDGTLMFYAENEESTEGFVAILPKNATEWKTWTGKATTDENGKETVTDDKTGETFSYTWTKNNEDGTLAIEADGYGKAMGVEMTVADWMLLEELGKALDL